jgi:hypothetical protein
LLEKETKVTGWIYDVDTGKVSLFPFMSWYHVLKCSIRSAKLYGDISAG